MSVFSTDDQPIDIIMKNKVWSSIFFHFFFTFANALCLIRSLQSNTTHSERTNSALDEYEWRKAKAIIMLDPR